MGIDEGCPVNSSYLEEEKPRKKKESRLTKSERHKIFCEEMCKLRAQIEKEIKKRVHDPTFMSSEYRRLRLEGYSEEQLEHRRNWIYK